MASRRPIYTFQLTGYPTESNDKMYLRLLSYCARKIGSRVFAVALLNNKNKKQVTGPVYVAPINVTSRPLIGCEPNLTGLLTSLT